MGTLSDRGGGAVMTNGSDWLSNAVHLPIPWDGSDVFCVAALFITTITKWNVWGGGEVWE